MLHFDPATTSGSAVASLFRVWCSLRETGPGHRPEAAELASAVEEMFAGLGLDPDGPPAQVEPPGTGEVFTVFGLRYDRADALLVAGVIPGEHAAAAVELDGDETDFTRWIDTFRAESGDAAATAARAQVEGGNY
ncbi:hypothetical protein GCM10010269_21200 [Streptomyces humidus]|uniref:Uncharacterized protein n=1 Tax=Streptomyces humidus TaxID=52259 RepID=A0A918FU53_9ACTN|nr:hypothetical protein [Streptomyces humidus]GGR81748.1 hypothetical protein GCM10010269_21200 [Streptomyces humidus]